VQKSILPESTPAIRQRGIARGQNSVSAAAEEQYGELQKLADLEGLEKEEFRKIRFLAKKTGKTEHLYFRLTQRRHIFQQISVNSQNRPQKQRTLL
jgi:hypothetical protein